MSKIILSFLVVLIMPFVASAQIIYQGGSALDTTVFDFSTADSLSHVLINPQTWNSQTISIDTEGCHLWQIGNTHKPVFSITDTVTVRGMMTDTLNPYPVNANDWFTIKFDTSAPNFVIDFWHQYQTDSAHDGGIVEFSLDSGATWVNVVYCNPAFFGIITENFYSASDTLATGDPAFSGTSDGEQYSRLQFFDCIGERTTVTGCSFMAGQNIFVRFRFLSDSLIDSLSGWIIDSIKIENTGCFGLVKNINKPNSLKTYPNPSYDGIFSFPAIENEQTYTTEVYNAMGQKILERPYSHSLDISPYAKGLYFYRITDGTEYFTGQLLTE